MSHKNEENSVIDAFLGLDISNLINADVETLANPDLEHWEAALPVYGHQASLPVYGYGSPGTNINDVEVVHEATGGLWMENNKDVKDDINFWRQTTPDNKFRCHSSSELSPFSNMGDSCYVEKICQDNSTFQQTEEEGILGLRGLRKLSESLEEGKDGVYNEKDIAKKYEEEQPNIVKNIEHLLEDEEFDEAKTNLDEVKLDIPEEWKSPFPSPPALETDENGQAFCFSQQSDENGQSFCFRPQTDKNGQAFSFRPQTDENGQAFCFSPQTNENGQSFCFSPQTDENGQSFCFRPQTDEKGKSFCFSPQMPHDSLLSSDSPCFSSPPFSPYNNSISPSQPSCFYSPSPSPYNSLGFTSNRSCFSSPCSSPHPPSYSQPSSGYSSPAKDQSRHYIASPPPLSRSEPPFSSCPPPPAYGRVPLRSSQLLEQCGSRPGQLFQQCGSRPVDICGPTAAKLKRNVDFPVYVHPNAVPKKANILTNYGSETRLDNPKSFAPAARLDNPSSYATLARLDVSKSYATAVRRSRTIPRLNSSKNLPVKAQICGFCRQNGERKEIFRSHNKADENGAVTCPYLASHVCEICGATGQNAHTKTYCPKLPKKQVPLPVALKNTKRKSDGKLRK